MPDPSMYNVGWICAIRPEYVAAQAFLDEKHEPPDQVNWNDSNIYTLGRLGKHNVVIGTLPDGDYGIGPAVSVAKGMLSSFPNLRIGLMVGVGGGAPSSKNDIRLGDIVVSAPRGGRGGVFQYDFGKTIQDRKFQTIGFLNQPPELLRAAMADIQAEYELDGHQLEEAINEALERKPRLRRNYQRPTNNSDKLFKSGQVHGEADNADCTAACGEGPSCFVERRGRTGDEDNPAIHYGTIASANNLMKDALIRDRLAAEENVLCFEMEAAGLMNPFPCVVIRGICDYADSHKNKQWQGYAAMAAAAYAKDLLRRIPVTRLEAERKISAVLESIDETLSQLQVTGNETLTVVKDVQNSTNRRMTKLDLDKLPYASGAMFNSKDQDHTTCHPRTRADLLRQIKDWIQQPNSKSIFWLKGSAGTGKSTISWTIATWLTSGNSRGVADLGASFFFRRGEADRGSASRFFSTIVRQLVLKIPDLDELIADVIASDPFICDKSLGEQFNKLLYHPLRKIRMVDCPILVFVVDALDECENEKDIQAIISLWARMQQITAVRFRLFITSRPELPIRLEFRALPDATYENMSVDEYHDIILCDASRQTTIQHDISVFLDDAFSLFQHNYRTPVSKEQLTHGWPGATGLKTLVDMAIPLFIVATTIHRFVTDKHCNPGEQLRKILGFRAIGRLKPMEQTYLPVLEQVSASYANSYNEESLCAECRMIIGSIVALAEPLSKTSLATLLQVSPDALELRLDLLYAVLRVPDDLETPIRTLHLSFGEFMLSDEPRHKLQVRGAEIHALLLTKCLQQLFGTDDLKPSGLHENLCDLQFPGQPRRDVAQATISQRLPPALQYACRYWVHHVKQGNANIHDGCQVHLFLEKHFLHWLEAMSLLDRTADVIAYVKVLLSLVPAQGGSIELRAFLEDAQRFTLTHRYIADLAPLQLYSYALAFTPQSSIIRKIYGKVPKWLPELPITSATWGPELQKLEGHLAGVNSVAFSPDGLLLASASDDDTVKLWSPSTGQEIQTLEGHVASVNAVAFSPDGSLLASGSSDDTIRLWSPSTGQEIQTLEGHAALIIAVTFSHDGSLLASASYDNTIGLWSLSVDQKMRKLEGHTDYVTAVAFCPDGSLLASASHDTTVRLWDPSTGQETQKLEGHDAFVNAVAFSVDGSLLASASHDNTIRLWNLKTSQEIQRLEDQNNIISAVAFSPDGSFLTSASHDHTITLWSLSTSQEMRKLKGHTNSITAITFSPDGLLLASASNDKTIRLWIPNINQDMQQLEKHSKPVTAISLSPDGSILASTSFNDRGIRLWNPSTGQEIQKLESYIDSVNTITFSPDGSLLAFISYPKAISLWSPITSREVYKLEGHTKSVNKIAFSPDGSLLASTSNDNTIRLWDTNTGRRIQTLMGHIHATNIVAFSPDGSLLASTSLDSIIRLWSPDTGEELLKLEGHTDSVNAVAFSPDGLLLASASYSDTVRLWNPNTGQEVQILENVSGITSIGFSIDGMALVTNKGALSIDERLLSERAITSLSNKNIAIKDGWIQKDEKNYFWLPHEYRTGLSAVHGNTVAFGLRSGQVSFIQFQTQYMM